ncbi:MAG TPA: SpoIIE family protein phosphatase, partial [Candidatus Sabulitectum sp.]|nr:SpoIIE family protein phosphatase [Candidatus Sabulitectum sp.]
YFLLIRNHRMTTVKLEKRQTRLVILGSAPGLVIYTLFFWTVVLFGEWYLGLAVVSRILITNLIFLLMLGVPITLGFAIGKYRLLHLEGRIKRGTRFLAVNFTMLALFAGVLWALVRFVLSGVGLDSQNAILVTGIVLAMLFMWAQRKIRHRIEEYFYPERVKLRRLMKDFLASSMVRAEGEKFWKELEEKLADGLSAERIYPVIRVDGKGFFSGDLTEPTPFIPGDEFLRRLESKDNPLLFDEMIASGKIILSPEQRDWFIRRKSAILLPLVTTSGLMGFLVISTKTNGEDFTSEELELLQSFSAQTALVAENLELLGEKLQKEKLEEQLRVARSIQEGLLPQRIPKVPGLEIAPLIKFCLDVAGDYYDVIRLEDGRVVLSIGDVSGKGVGAALIMANLQASLRTTQAMGARLYESATKINRIVYENTPPEMFITFFMLCMDPEKKCVRYVNAGHNPPFLIKQDGTVKTLSTGGLLFGVTENAIYEEGELQLENGDIVLMYTDGVSEAMDSSEEEFGEKRIATLAAKNRALSLPDLLALIERSVKNFHGEDHYADDFTLLAARILGD